MILGEIREDTGHKAIAAGYIEDWNDDIFNSLLVVDESPTNYRKQRLVPFGEYVPFENHLRGMFGLLDIPLSQIQPSDSQNRKLASSTLRLAPAICYEASFERDVAEAIRQSDADAIVVVSEDAWFGDSLAPHQNFEMVRMRALEHSRYVVRAANSGISGIIAPTGEVLNQAEQFERTTIHAKIATMVGTTPYSRAGAQILIALIVLALLSMALLHQLHVRADRKSPY